MAMRVRVTIVILGIFGGLLVERCCRTAEEWRSWNDAGGLEKHYLVGVKTSLEKIFRDPKKLRGEVGGKVTVKAARNEYESFQIIIASRGDDIEKIEMESTQLTCSDQKAMIPKENVSFYQVGYVKTKKPPYDVEFVGWWPDPLLPLEEFDLKPVTIQPIWVTIYVPEGTPPGHYHGSIMVFPENAEAETVEVSLTVWDFNLPKEPNLQAVFSLYEHCIRDFYNYDAVPHKLLRRYYSFLLTHRINPTSLYIRLKPQPRFEDLQFCIDRGLNAFNIAYLHGWYHKAGEKKRYSEKFKRDVKSTLPRTMASLRDQQLMDLAFVFGPDEPEPRDFDVVKEVFTLAEQNAPGIKRVLTMGPTEELFGYVDVWVPRINKYDEQMCRQRQEIGEEIWLYISAANWHPYPNFFVDYPAIDHRILFWMAWKYDISGFLYYSINRWITNYSQDEKRWPEISWNTFTWGTHNGDGQLIYPGPGGEPYSSMRLEVIRDGLEDFEYLRMLQDQMSKLADSEVENKGELLRPAADLISSIKEKIVTDPTRYEKDPSQLTLYRQRVADEIVRISEIMNKASKI